MPTGYTYGVPTGEWAFEEFVWKCARGFGALISMRDDPASTAISFKRIEEECDRQIQYDEDRLRDERQKLEALLNMTPLEIEEAAISERLSAQKVDAQREEVKKLERERYQEFIDKAHKLPLGSIHDEFRTFMLNQLKSSMDWDCNYSPDRKEISPEELHLANIEASKKYIKSLEKEIESSKQRKIEALEWLHALEAQVPRPPHLNGDREFTTL